MDTEFVQQDPPPGQHRSVMRFVEHCKSQPGTWFVYRSDYRGNVSENHKRHPGMKWTQRQNGDGTNTLYGRFEPF